MITKEKAGNFNGNDVYLFTLDNSKGLVAEIYNYGCIIRSLKVNSRDIVLGRETFEDYLDNDGYLGAAIGRNSNRIENAEFVLNDVTYTLAKNDNGNNLHGGIFGFNRKVWDVETVDTDEPKLIFSTVSPDGEEGFPGTLSAKITYTITKDNSLKIEYEATTDKDTVYNPTNHSYFNLDGHSSGTIYNQSISVNADFYTPNTDMCFPCGEVLAVKGTPFDLNKKTKFDDAIHSEHSQIAMFGGIDHNFVINGSGFRKAAEASSSDDSITMEVFTDRPGIQIYTSNMLDKGCYKGGAEYGRHSAFCMETQFFPNAMAVPHFESPVLKAGDKFTSVTEYKFTIK